MPALGIARSEFQTIETKTASYQMTVLDHGKLFTNRGAGGAVTFTLPQTNDPGAALPAGWTVIIYAVAAQNVIVASNTTDTLIAMNDATADSVALQTANEIIGGGFTFIWDGTGWLTLHHTEEAQTVTVVTA